MLLALAEHIPLSSVVTDFSNRGGWSSTKVSLMVGQVSAVYACLSADGIGHMGDEIEVPF